MEPKLVLDQVAGEVEPGKTGGDDAAAIETKDDSTQASGEGNDLGVKEVPEELKEKEKELVRGFHAKMQALSEKEKSLEQYKTDAQALYDLSRAEWFKQAVQAEKQRRSGHAVEISEESFEAIKSDKRAFQEFLSNRDKQIMDGLRADFKSELEKINRGQKELMADKEFDRTAAKYGEDFVQADEANALAPYLDKGFDHETAYILYAQSQGKVAGKKPEAKPAEKRGGAIEKVGMSQSRGGPVVKAKSLGDALDRVFELSRKGVKDYRLERE